MTPEKIHSIPSHCVRIVLKSLNTKLTSRFSAEFQPHLSVSFTSLFGFENQSRVFYFLQTAGNKIEN